MTESPQPPQPPESQPPGGSPYPPQSPPPPPPGAGQAPPPPPGAGMQPAYAQQQQNAPGAVLALILGIVGLVICGLAAPFAFVQGRKAEQAVDQSGGAYAGRGMATAGKILGIVGTVLWLLWLVVIVIVVIGGAAAGG